MNVILITGIYDYIPARSLGVYLLRHYLNKRGYSCQVIDHCQEFNADRLYAMITKFIDGTTTCIGLSTTFWRDPEKRTWDNTQGMPPNLYHATTKIKRDFPHVKLIIGGAGLRNVGFQIEHVDNLVVGESEDLLPELLDFWTGKGDEPEKFYNSTTGKFYYTRPINKTHDISRCDFEWTDEDCIMPGESLPLETARGCIFKCKFCSYPHLGKKKFDYLKPTENIRNHLIKNYEKWGVTRYTMVDDTFNDSEQKIDQLLEITRSLPFQLNYVAYIRVDLVHRFEGMAEKLFESGLRACFFGLESLGSRASMAVGKGWSGKHARDYVPHLLKNIWKGRVNETLGFITGLPGDDKQSLLDSLKWINDNDFHSLWLGLGISSQKSLEKRSLQHTGFTSEFERNSSLYGYKFDENEKWYNGIWNSDSAEYFANNVMMPNRKNKRLSCWLHIQLGSMGYSEDEIWGLAKSGMRHIETITNDDFNVRKNKFINEYEQKILSL